MWSNKQLLVRLVLLLFPHFWFLAVSLAAPIKNKKFSEISRDL